ncbi:ABC transporter ATP-binding protein [Microvirga sp. VF16]|uniref:ABC transporter ATP-binding protein n=1 Tax=Microvirga sp. VF16 TaxID=2807101 RepID=UPI00193DAB35|nr:ABC transporter ATP-binding protein [Microvirga sp. VF16]QRM33150.1 ABC transporter ATP-binding protein [Microvirga sp. VF16]
MSSLIEVNAVAKTFSSQNGSVLALDTVSLDVAEGEFVVFLGPSGCGKSTLLRIIGGLTSSSSGYVRIGGRNIAGPDPAVGMVFQSYTSFPWLTVEDNVAFGLELSGSSKAGRQRRATEILGRVGLTKFARVYPSQLSGGMQQRVAIARTLALNPKVLLMDEPFGALDALTRVEMQSFLVDLWMQERKTVVFVTHDIDEAILLGDRIVVLSPHPGRISEIVDVPIPRPRTIEMTEEPEFVRMRHRLRTKIFQMASAAA